MLHDHTPRLEAARDKGEVAHRRGYPSLTYVGSNRVLSHGYLLEERVVVKGEDNVKGAVRPDLHAPLPYLVDDIRIMPV